MLENPVIQFKVVIFVQGTQKNFLLWAEPVLSPENLFEQRPVTFRIVTEEGATSRNQRTFDVFSGQDVKKFNLSLSDSRLIKLSVLKPNDLLDFKIIFENVHKKH